MSDDDGKSSGYQGIGGAFIYTDDPQELGRWYADVLGVETSPMGKSLYVELPSSALVPDDRTASTTFALMNEADKDKASGPASVRLNHRVADLDAVLARLSARGIAFDGPDDDYGRFAWCNDPAGHRVEIWEPPPADPLAGPVVVAPWGKSFATDGAGMSERMIDEVVVVNAPRAQVWQAWTDASLLSTWMCPACRVELRIGGRFEILFMPDAPEGMQGSDGCRVLSFIPERMLSFSWNAPPPHQYTRSRHTWVVVELTAAGAQTEVRLTHTGWPELTGAWTATFEYFEAAWPKVLANLVDHFA